MSILSGVLLKASQDSFTFMIRLSTGETVIFESLEVIDDEWVHLSGVEAVHPPIEKLNPERGMDVRLSEIVWAIDAPFGS